MKKYITVAALLAAGTVLATAEEWTTANTDPLSYDNATVHGFVFNLGSDLLATTPGDMDDIVCLDSIDIGWTQSLYGRGVGITTTFVLTGTDNVILAVAKDNLTSLQGGTSSIDFGGVEIGSTSTYRVWTANAENTYTVGETLSSGDILSTVGLRFAKYSATSEELGLAIISNSNGETWNPYAPVLTINTSSIPEPSAFGMLVGLGALALVASRRRRR